METIKEKHKPDSTLIDEPEERILGASDANNDSCYNSYIASQINAGTKKEDDEDTDDFDDEEENNNGEEGTEENPFEREPTDKEIIDNDLPFIDPEEDLFDDEDEIPL